MHFTETQTLVLGILADRAFSSPSNVAWISPLEQDIYAPGATISAKWISDETIDSPCLKLCMASLSDSQRFGSDGSTYANEGDCGAMVCPPLSKSAGVYEALVTVADFPSNFPSNGTFYIEMQDGGNKMRSPVFTLSRASGASTGIISSSDSAPVPGIEPQAQAQAPLGPANSPVTPVAPLASPLYPGSPSIAASSVLIPPSSLNQAYPTATIDPDVLSAKSIPSPATFAVPLSAAAAIILVASGLFLKHRRKLGAQQAKDAAKPSRTGTVSSCKSHASRESEVGHALQVLSRHHGYRSQPAPSFMPPDCEMENELDAFPHPAYARWEPPAYDYESRRRDPPTYLADTHSPTSPMRYPCRADRPHLPPIATTGNFVSASEQATHAVLADCMLPSPPLPSSTSTPRCLLPAPQKLHLRDDGSHRHPIDNSLGSPSDRWRSEKDLYARVETTC
ncbi:hypothetical protein C8R44DRAFT_769692 [Mycena epipterygia]|nr:hypothetical protein C8R44DRAFT_769692 [Mycena epipterygia]